MLSLASGDQTYSDRCVHRKTRKKLTSADCRGQRLKIKIYAASLRLLQLAAYQEATYGHQRQNAAGFGDRSSVIFH